MKLLREGGAVLSLRLGQAATNAAVGLLVARGLGPDGQGRYALGVMVVMFAAAIANAGVGLAAVPPLRRGDVGPRRMLRAQLVWIGAAAVVVIALFVAFLRTGAGEDLAARLGWTPAAALAVLGAVAALLAFDVLCFDLLALGRLRAGPAVNLGRALLHLTWLGIAMAAGGLDLQRALGIYAGAQAAAAAAALATVWRRSRGAPEPPGPPLPRLLGDTVRSGWFGQLSTVASLLHLRLDLVIVAAFHGARAVGVYSVAVMVGELLWLLPNALQPLLVWSSAGSDLSDGDATAARALRVALIATGAGAVVLAAIALPLFRIAFGADYAASARPLWALLPGIVAFAPGAVLAGDFIGRGRPVWNTQASLATVAVNVAAGLLLIPRWAETGAAWASTVAYGVGSMVMIHRFRAVSGLSWTALVRPRREDFFPDA